MSLRHEKDLTRKDGLAVLIYTLLLIAVTYLVVQVVVWAGKPPTHLQNKPTSTFESMGVEPTTTMEPVIETTTTTEAPPPPTTTTTEEPPPPTTAPSIRTTTTVRASRGVPRPEETNADFWRRLANCESADGRSGAFIGYFQFSPDTARKVGIDGSESYEEQRAAAQDWASRIHPNEGTSSGWPHCWWVALG